MAGVQRFQDLECHKLAVQIRREVLRLTCRESVKREFRYVHQIRDAARSAARNIAEGFSRFNPSEIVPYLSIVKGSLDEVRDEIKDGRESGYFSDDECDVVLDLVSRTIAAVMRWRRYLESPQARQFYERHKGTRRQRDYTPRTANRNPRTKNEPEP